MKKTAPVHAMTRIALCGILFGLLVACGGSEGSGTILTDSTSPPAIQTVAGNLDVGNQVQTTGLAALSTAGPALYLDDQLTQLPIDSQGRFEVRRLSDGDHSLFFRFSSAETVEVPFRIRGGRGLDLGVVAIRNGEVQSVSGFDGYHFGFLDADGDGINDQFIDANGDGICDQGTRYAGYPYLMNMGFLDQNNDGVNDLFHDADGDGLNDLDTRDYGQGFGFIDANGDAVNDRFIDANGDGICDLTGMPFGHPFGYSNLDGDNLNDRFLDSDGDGINDLTGQRYIAMPGWVDLNNDGDNDFFLDADGDGINDLTALPISYGHGFGFVDADNDGINDHFVDANGDGINDYTSGPYADASIHYGFAMPHLDLEGDGIDDQTGLAFCQGFGFVDADGNGVNDTFVDADGDGINDWTGRHYEQGFMSGFGTPGDPMGGNFNWPQGPMHGGAGMMP